MTDDPKEPPHLAAVPPPEPDLPDPTDEQIIETMAQFILMELPIATAFAPGFPASKLPGIAEFLANEQHMINTKILPRLLDPKEKYSHLILRFTTTPASPEEANLPRPGARVEAPRRLEGVTEPGIAAQSGLVFAFLQTPISRAMLRMNGYTYEFSFGDSDDAPSPKPLVLLK